MISMRRIEEAIGYTALCIPHCTINVVLCMCDIECGAIYVWYNVVYTMWCI